VIRRGAPKDSANPQDLALGGGAETSKSRNLREPDRARAAGREWSMALPIDGMRGFTFAPPPAAAAAARTPHPFRAFEGRRGFDLCGQSTE